MNKTDSRAVIKELTGIQMPEANCPNFNVNPNSDGCAFSVSNLTPEFTHIGGEVLFEDQERHYKNDFRKRVVIRYDDQVLSYRLCQASEDSDYKCFLVGAIRPISELDGLLDSAKSLCERRQ